MDGDQHTHNGLGVGALLRASRLRVGEELRDVAYMLRIRYPYLEAIEDGRYGELPGPTYAIGFIRAYAEHLGLDSEEVVRRFKSETADTTDRPDLAFPVPIPETSVPGGAIVFIGVVVAVLAYAGWYIGTTKDGFFAELISPPPERLLEAPPEPVAPPPPAPAATVVVVPPPETETAQEPEDQAVAAAEPEPLAEPEADPPATVEQPPVAAPVEAVTVVRLADQPEAPAAEPAAAQPEPVTPPEPVQTTTESMVAPPQEEEAPSEAAEEQDTSSAPEPAAAEEAAAEGEAAAEPPEVTAVVTPQAVAGDDQPAADADADADVADEAGDADVADVAGDADVADVADEAGDADVADVAGDADVADEADDAEPEAPRLAAAPETAAAPEVAAAPVPVPATGRVYGAEEGNYRILVRAKTSSWIQVRDDVANRLLLTRLLRAGDSYRVPDRPGLKLLTGNAGALEILVDGETVPPIGSEGVVRRGVALDAERLREGTATGE